MNNAALLQKILTYGNKNDQITALVLLGSQVRKEKCADQYSDIDIILVVQDTDSFIYDNDWLYEIDKYYITFIEKIDKTFEKRVVFEGGLDVDFIIIAQNNAKNDMRNGAIGQILSNGYQVLVDKRGIQNNLPEQSRHIYDMPSEAAYINVVHDFWYHAIWTSKKLLRGELWSAKSCMDGYMKNQLLWMIKFYEHVLNGADYNTWFNGRFLNMWADDDIKQQLTGTFAHYEKQDMIAALKRTMLLFRYLAMTIAEAINYTYPDVPDKYSSVWVEQNLQ